MGRLVYIDTGYQTVNAVQDLLETKMGAAQMGIVHSLQVHVSSDEGDAAENLQLNFKRAAGSFTSGSGGGSATVIKQSITDPAHGLATTERNNTTQAVAGSGTLETIGHYSGVLQVLSGEWEKSPTPEQWLTLKPAEAGILSLDEAPADALTLRAVMVLEIID